MKKNWGYKAAIAGAMFAGTGSLANATPVLYDDLYNGGNDGTYDADVVGNSRFEISSLTVDRVDDDLIVVINTNYANFVGAESTALGSLFIGDELNLNLSGSAPYGDDVFTADTGRFSYAFDYNGANPNSLATTEGEGTLYALDGSGTDVRLSQNLTSSGGFRHDQAVDIVSSGDDAPTDTGVDGIWKIGVGTITFNISNFFGLSGLPTTGLTLAWAMTCANDIILATNIPIPGRAPPPVPLPAGLLLLFSGLAGLGFMGRLKSKFVTPTA